MYEAILESALHGFTTLKSCLGLRKSHATKRHLCMEYNFSYPRQPLHAPRDDVARHAIGSDFINTSVCDHAACNRVAQCKTALILHCGRISQFLKKCKGKVLYSAVSNSQDSSKRFTLYFPDIPVQSDTISTSLGSIQLCYN